MKKSLKTTLSTSIEVVSREDERKMLNTLFKDNEKFNRRGNQDLETPIHKTFLANLIGGPQKHESHLVGHARVLLANN